jgi:O-acetyl-ADP-ribose deacetylase (regulator of RNase III)
VWSVARADATGRGAETRQRLDGLLAGCYRRCMELAREHGVRSIAFPAISTGIYGFPADRAAAIAVRIVRDTLPGSGVERVIFCCFSESAQAIYGALLAARAEEDRNA